MSRLCLRESNLNNIPTLQNKYNIFKLNITFMFNLYVKILCIFYTDYEIEYAIFILLHHPYFTN